MQPDANVTPTDVAQVQSFIDNQPAAPVAPAPAPQPVQEPAQQQPAAPVQQPAPSQAQSDPFQTLFASEPVAPTAPQQPVAQPQPQLTQPTEPTSPTLQPSQPVAPTQPTQAQPQAPVQTPVEAAAPVQSFDDYMASIVGDIAQPAGVPDASKVDPNDEASIGNFFQELMKTAEQNFETNFARKQAIQNSERQLWDGAFDKYGSLRSNKPLRDMVHAIRRADMDKGIATTPTQAADKLLDALKAQYQQGAADSAVITSIEAVQPNGGGGTEVATTLTNQNVLESVQTGGEQALTAYLNDQIQQGKL